MGLILVYLVSDDDVELNVLRCRADILGTVWSPSNSRLKTDHSQNDGDGEERGGRSRGGRVGGGGGEGGLLLSGTKIMHHNNLNRAKLNCL